jgi:hypothetical protein
MQALSSLGGLYPNEHSSLQLWLPQAEKILGVLCTAVTALSSLGGLFSKEHSSFQLSDEWC